jgi:hypothetical protein
MHLVCIGSSIMGQLVPYLQAAGYTITDLTQPGWLATDANIQSLIAKMSNLEIQPGFSMVLDLFSNCSHRFVQFDGTHALPHKDSGKYHMPGPVVTCNEDTFRKIIKSLSPVLLCAQQAKKIVIPPLPRYLFNTCCANTAHCTNFLDDGYTDTALNGITKLRGIIKRDCSAMGMQNKWVLDGVGALLGTPPGQSYGTNREAISELTPLLAKDGVHIERTGNKNLASGIVAALAQMREGNLPDDQKISAGNNVSGAAAGRRRDFYWRGFTSPVGDAIGRVAGLGGHQRPRQRPHAAAPHTPYNHMQRRDRGRPHHRPY